MEKPQVHYLALLLCGSVLVGCTAAPSGGPQAWIDAPLDGASLPLAPLEVVAHAAASDGVALVELSVDGAALSSAPPDDTAAALVSVRRAWQPEGPGNYTLRVRAQANGGAWSEAAQAVVTILGAETAAPSLTPTQAASAPTLALLTLTPLASATATASETPAPSLTPLGPPILTFTQSGNCRGGPGTVYPVITGYAAGVSLPINGRNAAGTWWRVPIAGTSTNCYASESVVQTSGDLSLVPVVPDPPTPTPTPADTQAPTARVLHSPSSANEPNESQPVTFSATARDNVGVARIEIWVAAPGEGFALRQTCQNATACSWVGGPFADGTLSYYAKAYDAAGNVGQSPTTTITIWSVVK